MIGCDRRGHAIGGNATGGPRKRRWPPIARAKAASFRLSVRPMKCCCAKALSVNAPTAATSSRQYERASAHPPDLRDRPAIGAEGRRHPCVASRVENSITASRIALHFRQEGAQAVPMIGATSTARSQRFRQRRRAGLVRLVVEVRRDEKKARRCGRARIKPHGRSSGSTRTPNV